MLRSLVLAAFLLLSLLWTASAWAKPERSAALSHTSGQAPTEADLAVTSNVAVTGGTLITVTTTDDELNSDGDCSLREAIEAVATNSNIDGCVAGSGDDTIDIPAGLYKLTLGQLELTSTLTLNGAVTGTTILDGGGNFRVLYIQPDATVLLQRLTIRHGRSVPEYDGGYENDGSGGGLANYGTIWIVASTIDNNRAEFSSQDPYSFMGSPGGGIFNAGLMTVTNSTISGNAAGDGLLNGNSHAGLTFCSPGGEGGGIANYGTLTLENATLTNNKPGKGGPQNEFACEYNGGPNGNIGGLYSDSSASTRIQNSIIAANERSDCGGSITSLGYNLIQDVADCTISSSDIQWGATLDPLQENGGPTQTHALAKNSRAIDAGDCTDSRGITVTVDQRGEPRPQGDGCDLGAYESPYTSTFEIRDTSLPLIRR